MKAGNKMDILISTKIMGYSVDEITKGARPLHAYSTNIEDAWQVAEALGITVIPIEGGSWFSIVGPRTGWVSPAEFLKCLSSGDFMRSGAAIAPTAAMSICLAALCAVEKRNALQEMIHPPLTRTVAPLATHLN